MYQGNLNLLGQYKLSRGWIWQGGEVTTGRVCYQKGFPIYVRNEGVIYFPVDTCISIKDICTRNQHWLPLRYIRKL